MKKQTRVWCRKCGEGRPTEEDDNSVPDIRVEYLHQMPLEAQPDAHVRCGNCGHTWWAKSGYERLRGYKEAARK